MIGVSERVELRYIMIHILLLYLKNLLSYTARHNYFHSLFLPLKSLPATYLYSVCTQSLRIVIAQCHSASKRQGLLPFGGRFVAEIFVKIC